MKIPEIREWSNQEISKIANIIGRQSRIINVSGWKDDDKYGKKYADYFSFDSYAISNYSEDKVKGTNNSFQHIIDLEQPLPSDLVENFDLVFNHTTLEHVYNPFIALNNLKLLTSDYILLVFPWKQKLHFINEGFEDYLRISPMFMRRYCTENDLHIIYESATPKPCLDIYLTYLLSKNEHPEIEKHSLDLDQENLKLGSNDSNSIRKYFIADCKKYVKSKLGF